MSEKQKEILENLSKSMANANEAQEGFLLGYAECLAQMSNESKTEESKEQ